MRDEMNDGPLYYCVVNTEIHGWSQHRGDNREPEMIGLSLTEIWRRRGSCWWLVADNRRIRLRRWSSVRLVHSVYTEVTALSGWHWPWCLCGVTLRRLGMRTVVYDATGNRFTTATGVTNDTWRQELWMNNKNESQTTSTTCRRRLTPWTAGMLNIVKTNTWKMISTQKLILQIVDLSCGWWFGWLQQVAGFLMFPFL